MLGAAGYLGLGRSPATVAEMYADAADHSAAVAVEETQEAGILQENEDAESAKRLALPEHASAAASSSGAGIALSLISL